MQQEVKLHKAESAWKPTHKDTKETKDDKDENETKTEVCKTRCFKCCLYVSYSILRMNFEFASNCSIIKWQIC